MAGSRDAMMEMNGNRIVEELVRQGAYCGTRSPLYADVLYALAEDAPHSAWFGALQDAWRGRRFAVGWEAAHLLLAGLHYAALRGAAEELAAVYPSCGGHGAGAGAAAKAFLHRAPQEFWNLLATANVQTNEVGRSVVWMLAAAAFFGGRRTPFHLVELGASAGLNLIGDRLAHDCRVTREADPTTGVTDWKDAPLEILSRTGLDVHPLCLSREEDRLWLKACVWADDLSRLARLEHAMTVLLGLADESGAPRMERCTFAEAPEWLSARRPAVRGEGLLVFNSIATIYLDDRAYETLRHGLADALAPWDGRALWVEYERARGTRAGPLELRIHRVVDGRLDSRVAGWGEPRPRELRVRSEWESCVA